MVKELTRLGVFAAILDGGGHILLVHQTETGRWTLPGGGVRFGEPPSAALHREVDEETGYRIVRSTLIGVHDNVYDPGDGIRRHGVRLLYRTEVEGALDLRSPEEIDDAGWFPVESLPDSITDWAALAASLADAG